ARVRRARAVPHPPRSRPPRTRGAAASSGTRRARTTARSHPPPARGGRRVNAPWIGSDAERLEAREPHAVGPGGRGARALPRRHPLLDGAMEAAVAAAEAALAPHREEVLREEPVPRPVERELVLLAGGEQDDARAQLGALGGAQRAQHLVVHGLVGEVRPL